MNERNGWMSEWAQELWKPAAGSSWAFCAHYNYNTEENQWLFLFLCFLALLPMKMWHQSIINLHLKYWVNTECSKEWQKSTHNAISNKLQQQAKEGKLRCCSNLDCEYCFKEDFKGGVGCLGSERFWGGREGDFEIYSLYSSRHGYH